MMKIVFGLLSFCWVLSAWAHQIIITEPSEERAYHRPVQDIVVEAQVRPALPEGYTVAILLNDNVMGDGAKVSIGTLDIAAGEYLLTAIIMDKDAKTIAKDSKIIYVIQNAPYVKKKMTAIKERQNYEALPWYKKLAIGINPKVQAPPKVTKDTPIRHIQ